LFSGYLSNGIVPLERQFPSPFVQAPDASFLVGTGTDTSGNQNQNRQIGGFEQWISAETKTCLNHKR
jgi:hypothetical protein